MRPAFYLSSISLPFLFHLVQQNKTRFFDTVDKYSSTLFTCAAVEEKEKKDNKMQT